MKQKFPKISYMLKNKQDVLNRTIIIIYKKKIIKAEQIIKEPQKARLHMFFPFL